MGAILTDSWARERTTCISSLECADKQRAGGLRVWAVVLALGTMPPGRCASPARPAFWACLLSPCAPGGQGLCLSPDVTGSGTQNSLCQVAVCDTVVLLFPGRDDGPWQGTRQPVAPKSVPGAAVLASRETPECRLAEEQP